jgi:hypothetical protein
MAGLIKLYVAANATDAHMLVALLAHEGIEAVVRGDGFVPLQGGHLFNMETRPSVWVLDDEYRQRAEVLAGEFARRGQAKEGDEWRCSCGEQVEAQFSECWNCGRGRPTFDVCR